MKKRNNPKFSVRQGLLDIKKQINEAVDTRHTSSRIVRQKRRLYLKQRGKCCFCKRMMYACFETSPSVALAATREHIVPRCRSHPNIGKNIALSCHRCNKIRGTIDYVIFELMALFVPHDDLPRVVKSPKIAAKYGFVL